MEKTIKEAINHYNSVKPDNSNLTVKTWLWQSLLYLANPDKKYNNEQMYRVPMKISKNELTLISV